MPNQLFELNRLPELSDEAILDEIRRVAALVPRSALTAEEFNRHSKVSRSTVTRRFGTWRGALSAAGLSDRLHPNHVEITDEEVLKALQDLSARLGKPQITVRDVEAHLPFGFSRLQKGWGNARAAFDAAGLTTASVERRYSDEECFENLLTVWAHYGRPPTYREMGSLPSRVGGKAYKLRFGSWNKALHAFTLRANSGVDPAPEVIAEAASSTTEESTGKRGPRDVPLGLRFKILRRDRFRCVLCGDNPPQNPDCVLNVDHINPWSLGGATVEENLRTLCAACNVGRSNRYND